MELDEGIAHALRGDAILFTGAGFSYNARNSLPPPDNKVPNARQFASQLSTLCGSKGAYDLPIISQHFMKVKGEYELLNEINRRFAITSVEKFHIEIAHVPWRRVYTTNYDNCFEFAATQCGKTWTPLTLDAVPTGSSNRCVHINGHIFELNIKNLQSQIKLTHSSYSADAFSTSKWSQQLRQDFNNAKAVFFIGYSMSDIDISRVLFASPDLRARTFFIVAPAEDEVLISPLEPYGSVFKLGAEDFALRISKCVLPKDASTEYQYTWLQRYDSKIDSSKPDDKAGIDLVTLGVINPAYVAWALGESGTNYMVRDPVLHHIFAELQRFPVLESVIDSPRKRELIIGYFQAIKDIPYCQKSALFWLHYAMARLSYGEFKEATLYFDHARSLAKGNPKDLIDIDNHYARLLIDSRTKSDEYDDHFRAFEMAHRILISQINRGTNKHFPFRQAKKYVEFISFRKELLTPAEVKQFVTYCKQVDSGIEHLTGSISRSSEVMECKNAMARAITIANGVA